MLGPAFRRVAILPRLGTSAIVSLLFFAAGSGAALGQDVLRPIVASSGASDDRFGRSVAISGETVVVGAYFADNDESGTTDSGAAYIFVLEDGEWECKAELSAKVDELEDGADFDRFGISVAVSGDTALVGAYFDDENGIDSGSAYLFTRQSEGCPGEEEGCSGECWTDQQRLEAPDGMASDRFGISVALFGDTAVVGADNSDLKGSNSGAVYVFTRVGEDWSTTPLQLTLSAGDGAAGDFFGFSVAVSGEDEGGSADTIVVGAYGHDAIEPRSGSAYVFTRTDAGWDTGSRLSASDGEEFDRFGISVALSGDTVMIGADARESESSETNSGAVYLFTRPDEGWGDLAEEPTFTPNEADEAPKFGRGVALLGDTAVIGAASENGGPSDAVYVFARSGESWAEDTEQPKLSYALYDLGPNVAISLDTLVIGAQRFDEDGEPFGPNLLPEPNALSLRLACLVTLAALAAAGRHRKRASD